MVNHTLSNSEILTQSKLKTSMSMELTSSEHATILETSWLMHSLLLNYSSEDLELNPGWDLFSEVNQLLGWSNKTLNSLKELPDIDGKKDHMLSLIWTTLKYTVETFWQSQDLMDLIKLLN